MLVSSNNGKIVLTEYLKGKIESILSYHKIPFLYDAVVAAIQKMNAEETTYSYYHGANMVKKRL